MKSCRHEITENSEGSQTALKKWADQIIKEAIRRALRGSQVAQKG